MMVFGNSMTLTADEERALQRRLSPLADARPTGEGLVRMRAAIARGLQRPDVIRGPGLRVWQRATLVGVAVALPLAAGGVLAAMPGSPVPGIPGNVLGNLGPVSRFASGDGGPLSQVSSLGHEDDGADDDDPPTGGDAAGTAGGSPVSTQAQHGAGTLGHDGDGGTTAGHDACAEATAHARETLQGLLGREDLPAEARTGLAGALAALEGCGTGNDEPDGEDENGDEPGQGHEACAAATEHAREMVAGLSGVVGVHGANGLAKALEAIDSCGLGAGANSGGSAEENGGAPAAPQGNRPPDAGPPPNAGPPDGVGPNNGSEAPLGAPATAGGPPEDVVPVSANGQGSGAQPQDAPGHPVGSPADGVGPPGDVAPTGADNESAPGPAAGVGTGPPTGVPPESVSVSDGLPVGIGPRAGRGH